MRLLDVIKPSSEYLEKSGVDDPLAEAETLIFYSAGVDRMTAYLNNPETEKDLLSRIRRLLRRRAKGEPLQYLIGHVDFLGLTIHVGRGVLIPRPETELLAEETIREVKRQMLHAGEKRENNKGRKKGRDSEFSILDLCTGSGCIALALAREFPSASVCGTDISRKAVHYAKKNALTNGIGNVTFFIGPLFEPLKKKSGFDLIVSNPPYVKRSDIKKLQREIKEWEPIEALDGGEDGLDFYRKIFSDAGTYLREKGEIVLELGFGQAGEVIAIAKKTGLKNIEIKRDLAGIERILKAGI
jgi:release factor glutamine methyltransferase